MWSINNINSYIFPFKSKVIYSQYGTYFLIKYKLERDYSTYYIYENKYWIFLTILKNVGSFNFTDNCDSLSSDINYKLKERYENRGKLRKTLINKWDGITDDVTRREMNIDKVLK